MIVGAVVPDPRYPNADPTPLRYRWGNNERRAQLKGLVCVVLCRGTKNSVLVQFVDNGEKVCTSRRAVWPL